ncbi:amidohydrolase family protein [Bradyrhizobium erythrophlei]|jgi:cytosine deaminase|uniref:Cytosine deaminase n=1 Tax=Bradyrhizobium erythrophlei TaxID=1437360 RepID=A0A1M7UP38_9BRAD|nr:amidohydrolase family protein [Bradyrhizobium erythrophlei]SHN84729.1 cytosine deaminase [Bradyrhizobium erythrophlei]
MRRPLMIRGGRVLCFGAATPEVLDVRIGGDGRIDGIGPSLPDGDAEILAVDGQLVLPGLVDMHQHLDKSRTRALLDNPSGTLAGAAAAYRELAPSITKEQMIARARRTVEACSVHGTVAIRSHTNIDPQTGVRGVEAMVALREECAGHMRIQVVGHVTSGATSMLPESEAWLGQAIELGIDAIGGVPAFSSEPIALLKLLFDCAERSGLPLDMHIDEHLDAGRAMFGEIARMTKAYGMAGRVVAGHSSALSAMAPDEAKRTIDELRDAGVGIVTLPAANLFLQGRDADRLPPRGLTRVRELLAAGIPVAAASDNIQDPFVPTGTGDLLEIARWTLLAGQFGLSDLRQMFEMVSSVPAEMIGLGADWGIRKGARADLLIARADTIDDLVASGALERTVMIEGRAVSSTSTKLSRP